MTLAKPIWVLNGPNLNMLGKREVELYGLTTLEEIQKECEQKTAFHGFDLDFRQTNYEGELINWIQESSLQASALIINAAGLSHTSVAIHDALKAIQIPKIEVHLTNPYAREPFRHYSFASSAVHAVIAGLGRKSYILALEALITTYLQNT